APGMDLEARDADRQLVHLSPDSGPDGVAHGLVDLARDLGDRQALRDAEVHPDRERAAGDGHAQAAWTVLDPAEHAIRPVAGEARDPVLAQGHAADDVDDGAPG